MRSHPIRVYLISTDRLYSEGLSCVLARHPEFDVVGSADDVATAAVPVGTPDPIVVLLRIDAECGMTHLRPLRDLVGPRIVVLGLPDRDDLIVTCLEAGAAGYLTRDGSMADLRRTIVAAADGQFHCSPRIAGLLVRRLADVSAAGPARERSAGTALSRREREIAQLIARRLSNKEIAHCLGIQLATVKNHVHNILAKLEVPSRSDAAAVVAFAAVEAGTRRLDPRPAAA
jgi:two-component system, NarL family, nitrate/nitrite response regulator NarL